MSRIEEPRGPRPNRPDTQAVRDGAPPRRGPSFDEVYDQASIPEGSGSERADVPAVREEAREGNQSDQRGGADPGAPARQDTQRAEEPPPARGAGARIPPELVQRLVEVMRVHAPRPGVHRVDLALRAPGYQGTAVRLTSDQGRVTAVLVVERAAQKEALELRLPELRAKLEAEGVKVASLRVESRGDGRGGSGHSSHSDTEPEASEAPEEGQNT